MCKPALETCSLPIGTQTTNLLIQTPYNSVSDPDSDKGVTVIAVGNPGVGKSLFLNILIGDHVFKSGITTGKGRSI